MHLHRRVAAWLVISAGLAVCSPRAFAELAVPSEARHAAARIVIQHGGRHKPLDSFAWETLKLITGSAQWQGQRSVDTVVSILADSDRWQAVPLIAVPFVPLREALGMDRHAARISYNDVVASRKLMRMLPPIVQKQQVDEKLTMLENETMDAFQRFAALSALFEHRLELVPPAHVLDRSWLLVLQPEGYPAEQQERIRSAWSAFIAALRGGSQEAITAATVELARTLRELNPSAQPPAWRVELELLYNRVGPFRIAKLLYLLAFLLFAWRLGAPPAAAVRAGFWLLGAAYLAHLAGIAMRVLIGARPPVSNFFETMLWLPFVTVTVALVFERVYRSRYFALAAALLAAIVLSLADVVPLDASISPVVAVLHSNLWLTVHVLTIVASYGAIALAVGLAHVYAVLYLMRRSDRDAFDRIGTFLYRALQVGVVLLAGGIMLGAVWANASWGRYWGWDPKETWALITLLWYIALLHGRFAGWLRGIGVPLVAISGFFLLLMTYYGVSFYLVGLHSYAGGNAKPLPPLLIAYAAAELAFLAWVGAAALSRRPRSS
ncbi:MAG: cytochrome c biogenesis protein CcsA [Candidatus Omnitrophica bacterium]|nr:cytochrome c biogenesis protein CcsA [Candidatus Omnitrophota bacterium]